MKIKTNFLYALWFRLQISVARDILLEKQTNYYLLFVHLKQAFTGPNNKSCVYVVTDFNFKQHLKKLNILIVFHDFPRVKKQSSFV